MTRVNEKTCANCGCSFTKDKRNTWAYWEKAKYCGHACAGIGVARLKAEQRPSIEEKFWLNVEKEDGCWPWTGSTDKDGYGILEYEGKFFRANVFSLKLDGRPVPQGQYACHTCDNPPCVRPDHLYPGTPTQNMADALARGRLQIGERHYAAKLTEASVVEIRNSHETDKTLAERYGVSDSLIYLVRARKCWKHVA